LKRDHKQQQETSPCVPPRVCCTPHFSVYETTTVNSAHQYSPLSDYQCYIHDKTSAFYWR